MSEANDSGSVPAPGPAPTPDAAEAKVLDTLAKVSQRDPATIENGHQLIRDLQMDSVNTLDLLLELEEFLGVEISEVDAAGLQTVGDVIGYVRRRAAERTA